MIIFRIDDIGASAKWYNQHGKTTLRYKGWPYFYFPFANIGFFKILPPFRKWAKYDELTKEEWKKFLTIFENHNIKPIIAITATWVGYDGTMIPFPQKFPGEAEILKDAAQKGKIIIANHGLTHCVVGQHRPRFWSSNRKYFREFWDWLPESVHEEHINRSQEILENHFQIPVEILVPPGNIWSIKTYRAAKKTNLKKIICNRYMTDSNIPLEGMEFIDDRQGFFNFHDRELKLHGETWLQEKINSIIS